MQMQALGKTTVKELATANAFSVAIVDGSGVQITSFGGGTQYTEDEAAAANPVGTACILIRQDTPAGLVTTDGDNLAQRGTNYGAGFVQVLTSAGAFVDTFGGGTQYTEDAAAAADPVGNALIMVRADTPAAVTTTDGDNVAARATNKGELYVKHIDAIPVTDNSGSLTVDNSSLSVVGTGTEAAAMRVTIATDSTGVLSVDDNGGSLTVDNATLSVTGGGVEASALRVTIASDSTGVLSVDDNGGSITIDGTVATGAEKAEDAAHSTGATGNFVLGVRNDAAATTFTSLDGDYSPLATDSAGRVGIADLGGSITVDGTITEANSAAIAASASVLDDWDETDRAKVNVIVGQAGIAAGTGVDGATVPRVTLATNVALPAGTNAIGKLAANSGVDIGDVDIASIATGTNAIGRVGHDITGMGHGVKTITSAGTDEALAGSTACKRVVVQAQTDNTSGIAVGASGVDATVATGTGVYLNPGDAFEIEIDNLADVFLDALVSGEGARYTYFT